VGKLWARRGHATAFSHCDRAAGIAGLRNQIDLARVWTVDRAAPALHGGGPTDFNVWAVVRWRIRPRPPQT